MTRKELDARILTAHSQDDGYLLAELYHQASEMERLVGDLDAAGFLLTHAYVFALESGHLDAAIMRKKLAADGRELNE